MSVLQLLVTTFERAEESSEKPAARIRERSINALGGACAEWDTLAHGQNLYEKLSIVWKPRWYRSLFIHAHFCMEHSIRPPVIVAEQFRAPRKLPHTL